MGRNIEVQTQALTSLSRDYKTYGQNVYSRYRTGSSRIERELESIIRKYSEYGSVTSQARSIQSKLREIERQAKEIEARSSKLSQGLSNVAASYKEEETQSKNIIQPQRLSVDKISNKTTNVKVSVKLDSKLTASTVGAAAGTAAKAVIDKVVDITEGAIEKIKSSNVVSKIKGISKKVSNTLSNIKTSVSAAVTNFGKKVSEVATGIKKTAVKFTSTVKDKWDNLKSGVKNFTKKTKDFVCDLGKKIVDGLTGAFKKFKEVAEKSIEYIKDKGDVILDTLKKVGVKLLDGTQFVLDILGLVPGFGEIADGINSIIYALRGDAINAALSLAACIPFAGWAATGGKIVGKLAKFVDKIGDIGKLVDRVKDFAKYFDKVKDLGKTVMKYGDNVINFIRRKGDDIWSIISKSKVVNKATELVGKLSKLGYDIQGYLVKQVDRVSASFGEWWMKQAQVGIVPKDVAEWINRKGSIEVLEEVGEHTIKEGAEEAGEKLVQKAFKEINIEDINDVIDAGDTFKVRLKDGTEITYKKIDLTPQELKQLEEKKLIDTYRTNLNKYQLQYYDTLQDGLITDQAWDEVYDYVQDLGLDFNTLSQAEKDKYIEIIKDRIKIDPDELKVAQKKAAELLELSNERLQDAIKAGYSEADYYKILNVDKNRRDPKAYLESLEGSNLINEWKNDFYGNDSKVVISYMSEKDYQRFVEGYGSIGRPGNTGGQFVLPEGIANNIEVKIAQMGSIQNCTPEFKKQLAVELGLPEKVFDSGVVRVEIPLDTSKYNTDLNLHIVTGIEEGCNYQWVPGTNTLGGIREGIINQITMKENEELFKWIMDNAKRQIN